MPSGTDPSDDREPPGLSGRRWWVLAVVLVGVGVGVRVWRVFLAGLPLRVDEIRVAWNLFERGPAGLARPLDYQQAAPVGFLWVVDGVVELLGRDAWVLRLVPLLAGCALLFVLLHLARRMLEGYAGLGVVLLAALNATLIMQATDLKQYSVDALAAACLLAAALPALREDATGRSRAVLGGVGAAALVMSHGAFFIAAGVGLVLGGLAVLARNKRAVLQLLAVAGVWLAVVALLYAVNLRHTAGRDDLMTYWAPDFMPTPAAEGAWAWYRSIPQRLTYAAGFAWAVQPVVGFMMLLGIVGLALRDWRWLAVVLAPFVLVLGLSMAGQYPFAGRMIAFLVPAALLLVGFGFELLRCRVPRVAQGIVLAAVGWALLTSLKLGERTDGMPIDFAGNFLDAHAGLARRVLFFTVAGCAIWALLSAVLGRVRKREAGQREASPSDWGLAVVSVVALWAIGATLPFSQVAHPWVGGRYDLDAPFAAVADGRQPSDGLIVEKRLYYPYKHYAGDYGLPAEGPLLHLPYYPGDPRGEAMRDEALRYEHVWVLAGVRTRTGRGEYVDTATLLLPLLAEFGPPKQTVRTGSVIAWRFDRSSTRDASPAQLP